MDTITAPAFIIVNRDNEKVDDATCSAQAMTIVTAWFKKDREHAPYYALPVK